MTKKTSKKTNTKKEVKKPIEKKVSDVNYILHKRIDDLIDDFTVSIKKVQDKLDKIASRMGLPKEWS